MTRDWFCQIAGKNYGPLTFEQMQRMAKAGQLPQDAPVRQGDVGDWYYAGSMPGLFAEPTPSAETAPATPQARQPSAKPAAKGSSTAAPQSDPHVPVAKPMGASKPARTTNPSKAAPPAPRTKPAQMPQRQGPGNSGTIPVGQIPTGKPVIPQGTPVVNSIPLSTTDVPISSAAIGKKGTSRPGAGKRGKKNQNLVLLAGGGGTVVVIAIVAYMMMSSGKPSANKVASRTVAATDVKAADANADETASKAPDANKKKAESKQESASPPPAASLEKNLKQIAKWTDLSKATGGKVKTSTMHVNLQIVAVWTDSGKSEEGAVNKPAYGRVYVELSLTNLATSTSPITYTTWNGKTGPGTQSTILADDQYRPASLVIAQKTPDLERQSAPVRLQPGKGVTDVLVFDTESPDFEFLYLVLPFTAIGPGDKPFAYKIPKTTILTQRPSDAPAQLAKTDGATRKPAGDAADPQMAKSEPAEPEVAPGAPKTAAAPVPPKSDEEKIPSIDELNKQILDEIKKQKEAEKKANEGK